MPSRGVAIFIHPYEIVLWQVDVIGNDKITTSHFLLKATANRTLQNYAVANDLTPASAHKYVISAFQKHVKRAQDNKPTSQANNICWQILIFRAL